MHYSSILSFAEGNIEGLWKACSPGGSQTIRDQRLATWDTSQVLLKILPQARIFLGEEITPTRTDLDGPRDPEVPDAAPHDS